MNTSTDGLVGKLYREYRLMLKPLPIESWPDLFFYRPLAFGLVKTILPLPITPNIISLPAIAVGLSGGYCLAQGTPQSVRIAGLLFLANVIKERNHALKKIREEETYFNARSMDVYIIKLRKVY